MARAEISPLRAVVVRSTDCIADSRVNRILAVLNSLGFSTHTLAWDREGRLTAKSSNADLYFRSEAGYGRGVRNAAHQFGFQRFVLSGLSRLKPDLVYACDLDGALTASNYCKRHQVPWLFDQFDLFRDRIPGAILSTKLGQLENRIARRATVRIVAADERRTGVFADAFVVGNAPSESVKSEPWKLTRLLFYGGVLQEDRGLQTAIAAMAHLRHWHLRIAGYGPLSNWIASQAALRANVHFLGRQSHDEVLSEMSRATAVLAMYDPAVSNNVVTASNKLGEAALVGRPLITSIGTGIDLSARHAGFGFSHYYGSVDSFLNAVRDVQDAFQQSTDIASACAKFQAERGWPRQRERLVAAINAAGVPDP